MIESNVVGVDRRGRTILPEARVDWLRAVLLNEYHGERGFVSDWMALLCHYERLLEALPRVTDPPVGDCGRQPEDLFGALDQIAAKRPRLVHLHRYRDEVKALCNKWGLRCAWAPAWVHWANLRWANRDMSIEDLELAFDALPPEMQKRTAAARDAILRSATGNQGGNGTKRRLPWLDCSLRKFVRGEAALPCLPSLVPEYFLDHDFISQFEASGRLDYLLGRGPGVDTERKLSVEIRYDILRDQNWSAVKQRVVEAARSEWQEDRRKALRAGFILQDTQPQLPTHVQWLFLRICPQADIGRPLGWRAIAQREHVSVAAVRDAVIPLANQLGLTLPDLPAGRPRRSS